MKSKLAEKIRELATICNDDDEFLFSKLEQIIEKRKATETIPTKTNSIHSIFKDYLLSDQIEQYQPIKTGWDNFDNLIGGIRPSEFIVIGGRPGMGKTIVLLDLLRRVALNAPVLFISLELNSDCISNRIISSVLDYEFPIKSPDDLRNIEKSKLNYISDYFDVLQLSVCETTFDSMFALKTYCEKMVAEKGIRVIGIDYLQMLSTNRYRHNRELEVSYISRTLKKIAKELNICLIATSQLSRSVETRGGDKRPQLADLRDSGSIEQDADKVIFIYRSEYYGITTDIDGVSTKGQMELILAKNRSGSMDRFFFLLTFPSLKLEPLKQWNEQFNFEREKSFVLPSKKIDLDDIPF